MPRDLSNLPRNDDPSQPISHKVGRGQESGYSSFTKRHNNAN